MTFEEWKAKHSDLIENVAITFFNYERGVDTKTCFDELEYLLKRAFNADRTQWHKVADGDLPEDGVQVLSEKGDVVIHKGFCWFEYSPNEDNIRLRNWEKPIAWCEKPKFEEIEENEQIKEDDA